MTFNCEVMTPMFLNGADGSTPELRAPSIKGALRFWWRAMNGHLPLEDRKDANGEIVEGLRTMEGKIFGSTSQRSKIIIQEISWVDAPNIIKEAKVPHKQFKNDAINKGFAFTVRCMLTKSEHFSESQLESLFFLTLTLGGLGNRVRRGFGSVKIEGFEDVSIDLIFKHLQNINPQFKQITEGGMTHIKSDFKLAPPYPFITMVELGRTQSSLVEKIADTTHDLLKKEGRTYEASLGFAGSRERFSSPIYVSVAPVKNGHAPIITTLNTVPPQSRTREVSSPLQKEFKRNIL